MKRDRAENIIQQKVRKLEGQASVDSDALWDRLNTRLEETPKRRRFPFYYAAVAAVLLIAVCIAALMRQEVAGSKVSIAIKAEKKLAEVQTVMRPEQPEKRETQTPMIVEETQKLSKRPRVDQQDATPPAIDEEQLEQLGKEAEYGLEANPIATNVCSSVNDDFSIN